MPPATGRDPKPLTSCLASLCFSSSVSAELSHQWAALLRLTSTTATGCLLRHPHTSPPSTTGPSATLPRRPVLLCSFPYFWLSTCRLCSPRQPLWPLQAYTAGHLSQPPTSASPADSQLSLLC
uniref:Uncharacterized protein n=1 Tax=Opuntia streptacantha TaxID=393608 RepID=A0A7C8YNJ3_OPUST